MSCYHPWIGLPRLTRTWLQNGKTMALRSDDQRLQLVAFVEGENFIEPFAIDAQTGEALYKYKIPCGKCIGCRLDYSRDWAARCAIEHKSILESKGKDAEFTSWFLTLTYDDDHVPLDSEYGNMTLQAKDMQDFWKRLRRWSEYHNYSTNIRYYQGSEYGSQYGRPHYHAVVFNLCIPDLKPWSRNGLGDQLYISQTITDLWGKGYVVIGEFTWNTAAYVARYIMKKQKGKDAIWYDAKNIEPEVARMSRKPGLGFEYFQAHANEIYTHDKIQLPDGKMITPPKYFDSLYSELNPGRLAEVKQARSERAIDQENKRLAATDYSEIEYFTVQENYKNNAVKALLRTL